jgi:hypothetical protein
VIANVFELNEKKLYWYIFHFTPILVTVPDISQGCALFSKYAGPFYELYWYIFPSAPFSQEPIFVTVLIHFSARAQTEVFLQSGGAAEGCANIKILIESEQILLQEATSFFS